MRRVFEMRIFPKRLSDKEYVEATRRYVQNFPRWRKWLLGLSIATSLAMTFLIGLIVKGFIQIANPGIPGFQGDRICGSSSDCCWGSGDCTAFTTST